VTAAILEDAACARFDDWLYRNRADRLAFLSARGWEGILRRSAVPSRSHPRRVRRIA
jgi:hypothetical protein